MQTYALVGLIFFMGNIFSDTTKTKYPESHLSRVRNSLLVGAVWPLMAAAIIAHSIDSIVASNKAKDT